MSWWTILSSTAASARQLGTWCSWYPHGSIMFVLYKIKGTTPHYLHYCYMNYVHSWYHTCCWHQNTPSQDQSCLGFQATLSLYWKKISPVNDRAHTSLNIHTTLKASFIKSMTSSNDSLYANLDYKAHNLLHVHTPWYQSVFGISGKLSVTSHFLSTTTVVAVTLIQVPGVWI